MKNFSFSYRGLFIFFGLVLAFLLACAWYMLSWLSNKVEARIIDNEVSALQVAIEAGPLQLARLHSASISNSQLTVLMDGYVRKFPQIQKAAILGGPGFSEVYGEWSSTKTEDEINCLQEITREYTYQTMLYPFKVILTQNKCIEFLPFVELKTSISRVFLGFQVASLVLIFVCLIPVAKSFFLMARYYRRPGDADSADFNQIPFLPVRQITVLAMKARSLDKEAAVGRISAHLTHDMRAPIGTFERLLLASDEDLPKMRGAVRESVLRLYAMVDALRHGEIENIVIKSRTVLDFQFGQESLLGKAKKKNVTLIVPDQKFDGLYIDREKIERVWINLASNAIEFASSLVKVELELKGADLLIRVIDDGPGVPKDFMPKLFKRGQTFGKEDGTGLGLAFVKQIVEGHGGDVRYLREGNFTVFECYLPNVTVLNEQKLEPETEVLDTKSVPVIQVAICLEPESLSDFILGELQSLPSKEFTFVKSRDRAKVVVSNVEDIMFEVLENDEQEYFSLAQYKNDKEFMLQILKRKFKIN